MARDDWYRNKEWTADIEAAFRTKLSKARSQKSQYIVIQAGYLAHGYPAAALALIDEYFKTGDDFDVARAYCVQAEARLSLGRIGEAVVSYKEALDYETRRPGVITTASLDLAKIVAENRLSSEYDFTLEILTTRFKESDFSFPNLRYVWNGSNALIADDLGHHVEAQEFAERALRAAAETESPYRYHRTMGLVKNSSDDFGRRIKRIARPSKMRALFRLAISK